MSANQPTWFGQPRGLTILFLTEMWEIFSYYGMRTLLVYYMTKQLLIGQEKASFIYGTYTAMAYFTPILGGVIADRWLGKRRAVIIGASIMAAGHFMMAFEPSFYLALATIALGNGLFLPSLPSQINDLYRPDDPRRSWAYNVYYVGINLGGFLAPLVCGTLGEFYGWHWGFGAAGVGMLAGLVIYILGGRYLPEQARVVRKAAPASTSMLNHRSTLVLLLAIGLAVTVFRAAYEQIGNTVALWTDVGIDRTTALMTIPMTWFQSLNPLLVFIMTPLLLARWRRQAEAGRSQSSMRKMAVGALIVAGRVSAARIWWLSRPNRAARAGCGWCCTSPCSPWGSCTSCRPASGYSRAWRRPGSARRPSPHGILRFSAAASPRGPSAPCGASMTHGQFFLLLTVIASLAAAMLLALDRSTQRIESERAVEAATSTAIQPEYS